MEIAVTREPDSTLSFASASQIFRRKALVKILKDTSYSIKMVHKSIPPPPPPPRWVVEVNAAPQPPSKSSNIPDPPGYTASSSSNSKVRIELHELVYENMLSHRSESSSKAIKSKTPDSGGDGYVEGQKVLGSRACSS